MPLTSTARVATATPERYAKQLVAHLGHKAQVREVPDDDAARLVILSAGTGLVRPEDGELLMTATADDAERLAVVEDVLARHLVRFGRRDELVVVWHPGA